MPPGSRQHHEIFAHLDAFLRDWKLVHEALLSCACWRDAPSDALLAYTHDPVPKRAGDCYYVYDPFTVPDCMHILLCVCGFQIRSWIKDSKILVLHRFTGK